MTFGLASSRDYIHPAKRRSPMSLLTKSIDYRPILAIPQIDVIDKCHFEIVRGCQLRCLGCPNSTLQPKVRRIEPDDFDQCLRNIDVKHIEYFRLFNFGE